MRDYSKYSDLELVALLGENSSTVNDVFNIIYQKYSSQVYGYCLYKTSTADEAKELMQETWLNFFKAAQSGKSVSRILPYLFTTARNITINNFRHRQSTGLTDTGYFDAIDIGQIAGSIDIAGDMEKDELFSMIKIAIHSMKDIYKETLLLYWFGDLKHSEIARVCGESEATVRKRFERAMEQLTKIIKPYLV